MMHLTTPISNSQYKHISKLHHVTTTIMKMVKNKTLITKTIPLPLRILVPAIASTIFFLLWLIFGRFKYVSLEHKKYQITRKVELATVFGGVALLILGLALMADLALSLTVRFQQLEDTDNTNHGLTSTMEINEVSKGAKATCRIIRTIIRMFGTAIAMSMLVWIIYTGFQLATEPSIDSRYKHLAFAIGVISIAFGVIYFVIGLAIGRELAFDLTNRLQRRKGNWNSMNQQIC